MLENNANLWIPIIGLAIAFGGMIWKMSSGFTSLKMEIRNLGDRLENGVDRQTALLRTVTRHGEKIASMESRCRTRHPQGSGP